jgi:hypothetical protein
VLWVWSFCLPRGIAFVEWRVMEAHASCHHAFFTVHATRCDACSSSPPVPLQTTCSPPRLLIMNLQRPWLLIGPIQNGQPCFQPSFSQRYVCDFFIFVLLFCFMMK